MNNKNYKIFEELLETADIKINGDRPWDIRINSEETFERVLKDGSLGFGEAYMDNLWECDSIDEMINRALRAKIDTKLTGKQKFKLSKAKLKNLVNHQSIARAKKDVSSHYDLGNDIFEAMLDKYMAYTCAYFEDTDDLEVAQEKKLDLVCKKMGLQPGMRVLDIGCGWGSFMKYAAQHYGVICDGITLSKEQTKLGQEKCEGLDVNFILQDYREFTPTEKYDRVVSIGMVEHVGPANYEDFFNCAESFLKKDGLFLLHTIGGVHSCRDGDLDPWTKKYIFPNGIIPSFSQLGGAMEDTFNIEDLHNIGPSYDRTLMAWNKNFEDSWDTLKGNYDERFHRMWRYYLLTCAGAFRARELNTWQFVLSKVGRALPVFSRTA